MHNHMRMYVASVCCNIAKSHWLNPAKWLYGNLLDGDVASNHLSWQWVAGAFSNKKYYANQNNINKYFNSNQENTFLDIEYSSFENLEIPTQLKETTLLKLPNKLNDLNHSEIETNTPTLIYNYYNIDPKWHLNENYQRILLLEPSFFEKYPSSQKCIDFTLALAKNINNIKIFIGEFSELKKQLRTEQIYFKEHPTNKHYEGTKEEREWISNVKGYFPSFFSFWKKCKKEIQYK